MPKTIYFRVGNSNHISLGAFVDSLRDFLGLLQDLDATLSAGGTGNTQWEVVVLRKNSPPLVGVKGTPRRLDREDLGEAIESQVIQNVHSLGHSSERTDYFSDSALKRMKKLSGRSKSIGPMAVYVDAGSEQLITEATANHVAELTDPKYSAYGSIMGKLEAISVHKGNEFRIWDKNTLKPVRCTFTTEREEKVKTLLRHNVIVSGIIKYNSSGAPISLELEELDQNPDRQDLPSIEEMSGCIKDFTRGKSLKEYLEDMSNE